MALRAVAAHSVFEKAGWTEAVARDSVAFALQAEGGRAQASRALEGAAFCYYLRI